MNLKTGLLRESQGLEVSPPHKLKDTLDTLEQKHGALLARSLGWSPKETSSGEPTMVNGFPMGRLTGCVLQYQDGAEYELKYDSKTGQLELLTCPPWNLK